MQTQLEPDSDGFGYMLKRYNEQKGNIVPTNNRINNNNNNNNDNKKKEEEIEKDLKAANLLSKFTTLQPTLNNDTRRIKALFLLKAYMFNEKEDIDNLLKEASEMNLVLLEECINTIYAIK